MPDDDRIRTEVALISADVRVAIGRVARRVKQLYEVGETTFSETSVLSRLARAGPVTPGTLAAAEHVRPQAIVVIVKDLVRRGLVVRDQDPLDGRRVLISLTAAGRQALEDKSRVVTQRMGYVLREHFSPNEQRQLWEALPLLERLAEML